MFNTSQTYGLIAIILHWLIAIGIIGLFISGKVMTDFIQPNTPTQFTVYQLHKSFGITILILSLIRLWWRWINPIPALPENTPLWQKILSSTTHRAFYALMILLPLSGWAMVSASPWNIPTILYGIVPWPDLPLPDSRPLEERFISIHFTLGMILFFLFLLHVGAALWHHFWLKDTVLERILRIRKTL